ncbi:hypothetical protein Bca4012_076246 [Brassica carinata]
MSENFDSLERIVRSLYNLAIGTPISMTYRLPEWMLIPDGNKTPPITILQTPDVQVMMAVRAWFADLTLCVTIGAEDVSRYQFFCRADFNIGSSSYKFRNGNEDPSFEGFLGEAVVASQAVLEEYFNDQEMMVIHRTLSTFLNLTCLTIHQWNTMRGFPSKDLVIVQSSSPVIDDGISFWEGVIASENDNDVKDDEHSDEMDLDIPMSQNISQLQQNCTTNVDDANSSTDSTPGLDDWRVYATKLKYSDVYEIRKLDPTHTCSVVDRSGYQSQVTHHVVGEMMKARFNGSGGGPKPGEIRQVMQGDHDVCISC